MVKTLGLKTFPVWSATISKARFFKYHFLSSKRQSLFSSIEAYSCLSAQYLQFCALVMEMIGQMPLYLLHISLETFPCNCETPFASFANRKATNEWLNWLSSMPVSFLTSSMLKPQK